MSPTRRPPSLLLLLLVLCSLCLLAAPLRVSAVGKKLSAKELEAIEEQWMADEEMTEDDAPVQRAPAGSRMPPAPSGPKAEMGFVTLRAGGETEKLDKAQTDGLAGQWSDQMNAAGITVRAYTIEARRILFVCDERGYKDMKRVRTFVLAQPQTEEFEWNNHKTRPEEITQKEKNKQQQKKRGQHKRKGKQQQEASVDLAEDEEGLDPVTKLRQAQDEQEMENRRQLRRKQKEEQERKRKEQKAKEKAEKKAKRAAEKKRREELSAKLEAEKQQKKEQHLKGEL